ncbi:hypothetical protein POJ06DRAFT_263846 [Lipomyces tetrasporus]|uniref:Uncharacterized protein n=1 Tax=Lipomyces tetrasporus TaxID=54092 RepID=A0AAD7QKH3_9ASCO|nr:uncharacterized protein POJ06DRAFT_263846 [Lipomyces tetrasporus]KAJ8096555.1 hypothetical protein POJ06DRAFT_263846 [Lipomyces tetrasporus]
MALAGDNVNLGLTIEDIFPFSDEDIEDIRSVRIYLSTSTLQEFLEEGAFETAQERFKCKMRQRLTKIRNKARAISKKKKVLEIFSL